MNQCIGDGDNGSEFIGSWQAKEKSGFTKVIEEEKPNCIHQTIPPGAHRWQADIETIHRLIEEEFYEVETFKSKEDFKQKITPYQYFFNLVKIIQKMENLHLILFKKENQILILK